MPKTFTGLAVTGLILGVAAPASAQGQRVEGGEYRPPDAAGAASPIRPSRELQLREVAAPPSARETRFLGSVDLGDNAALGVGLFSVVGATEKEIVRRRTAPRLGTDGDDSRVAAIGFSLRF